MVQQKCIKMLYAQTVSHGIL